MKVLPMVLFGGFFGLAGRLLRSELRKVGFSFCGKKGKYLVFS